MVKDVIASYEMLINLFERTQLFLQRLNHYIATSLTPDMTELLAKILAQVLSVLALSTKEMKERRISVLILSRYLLLADNSVERFMKRLVGRTEVEDGLQRLDMLTREENLMTAACICQDVNVIKDDAREIKDNLRINKHGTFHFFNVFLFVLIFPCHELNLAIDELQRLLLSDVYHH